ncbi:hypothetical protein BJX61DRAFT_323941 [Aspergillus egyptiacus]|nr:hypothetical protein BJX61DRAFT_323941 [Aspergillus egyptiacus]
MEQRRQLRRFPRSGQVVRLLQVCITSRIHANHHQSPPPSLASCQEPPPVLSCPVSIPWPTRALSLHVGYSNAAKLIPSAQRDRWETGDGAALGREESNGVESAELCWSGLRTILENNGSGQPMETGKLYGDRVCPIVRNSIFIFRIWSIPQVRRPRGLAYRYCLSRRAASA